MEGKLQFHSGLVLMAQVPVPCWNQMQAHIFESFQLEGSYVGDLVYSVKGHLRLSQPDPILLGVRKWDLLMTYLTARTLMSYFPGTLDGIPGSCHEAFSGAIRTGGEDGGE